MSRTKQVQFICGLCLRPMQPAGAERLHQEQGPIQILPYLCDPCTSRWNSAPEGPRADMAARATRNRSEWGVLK